MGRLLPTRQKKIPEALPISKSEPVLSDFIHGTWGAIFVAKTLPDEQVHRLHKALTAACHQAQFQSQTLASGSEPAPSMTLSELERFFDEETKLYQAMAREIGIQPE